MAKDGLARALPLTLAHEGGYVNHPKDPGGPTFKGVTQRVYDAYRAGLGQAARDVRQIDPAELQAIYERQYWDQVHGDDLPAGLDYAVFDFAVNSGPGRAVEELQRVLGVGVDGKLGLMTLQALRARPDVPVLIGEYCAARVAFLKTLRTWSTFGKGWSRRVEGGTEGAQAGDSGVIDLAVAMAGGFDIPPKIHPASIGSKPGEVSGKGLDQDQKVITAAAAAPAASHAGAGLIGAAGTALASAAGLAPKVAQQASAARDIVSQNQSFLPALAHVAAALTAVIVVCGLLGLAYQWWRQRHPPATARA